MEAHLVDDQEAARWFFEDSDDLFALIRDGTIVKVNRAWTALTGWDEVEVAGKPATRFLREDDGPAFKSIGAASHGLLMRSGEWAPVLIRSRTLPSGATAMAMRDLSSERRAAEAFEAAQQAKAHFLANISHEIRTPMNGVLGTLHLLKAETLSGEGRRLLEEALACGGMLSTMLGDLIDFARLEAGEMQLSQEPMNVAAALANVADLLRPRAEEKGLRLYAAPMAESWAVGDPLRLRQMMFNLVCNAVKFTERGRVELRLRLEGDGEAQRLLFEVEDTGPGISPDAHGSIFHGFHQADNSPTRRHGGVGLGLALTHRMARLVGGCVSFDSRPGEGSVFRLELPAPASRAPAETPGSACPERLDGLRVLVIEDNATNRLIATKMLEHLGASVAVANDGREGVEAARLQNFDLIFMDIQMPGMDGVAAAREIRRLPGQSGETPILALTANSLPEQVSAYLAAGMNGHVAKPLSPAALARALADVAGPVKRPRRDRAAVG